MDHQSTNNENGCRRAKTWPLHVAVEWPPDIDGSCSYPGRRFVHTCCPSAGCGARPGHCGRVGCSQTCPGKVPSCLLDETQNEAQILTHAKRNSFWRTANSLLEVIEVECLHLNGDCRFVPAQRLGAWKEEGGTEQVLAHCQ